MTHASPIMWPGLGAEVIMTPTSCQNGTERCAEVAKLLPYYDLVVNLQGDAPLTPAWFVEDLIASLQGTTPRLILQHLFCAVMGAC